MIPDGAGRGGTTTSSSSSIAAVTNASSTTKKSSAGTPSSISDHGSTSPASSSWHSNNVSKVMAPDTASATGTIEGVTGRPPVLVFMDCDEDSLSEYQCLLRKQIELFEA